MHTGSDNRIGFFMSSLQHGLIKWVTIIVMIINKLSYKIHCPKGASYINGVEWEGERERSKECANRVQPRGDDEQNSEGSTISKS